MRIILVRHAEPDYAHDSLTPLGRQQADALAFRLAQEHIDDFYVSPLGRAQETAKPALRICNKKAVTLPWLREFDLPNVNHPDQVHNLQIAWDWKPQTWTREADFYDFDKWYRNSYMQEGQVKEYYDEVVNSLNALLTQYGYVKESPSGYAVKESNHKTICLVCHFGVTGVILSELMHISPMVLWHSTVITPSGVTILATEERDQGHAIFRINELGDLSHLYAAHVQPSFAARYCECFEDPQLH